MGRKTARAIGGGASRALAGAGQLAGAAAKTTFNKAIVVKTAIVNAAITARTLWKNRDWRQFAFITKNFFKKMNLLLHLLN